MIFSKDGNNTFVGAKDDIFRQGIYYLNKVSPLQDLIKNCGLLLYANSPINGLMIDGVNGYNIIITDISGTPNSGDFVDGNYFKMNGQYQEVIDADITNILYSIGVVPNIIEIATILPITNSQLYVNVDEKTIGFFATALAGICGSKAEDFFDVSSNLQDSLGLDLLDDISEALVEN